MINSISASFNLADSPLSKIPRIVGKPFNPKSLNRDFSWRLRISQQQSRTASDLLPYCDKINLCPICSHDKFSVFVTIYNFPYHECECCSHIYCSLIPNEGKLKQLYSGLDSFSAIQQSIYLDDEIYVERVKAIATPKVSYVQSLVDDKGLWVDIGSGAGEILQAASSAGFSVMGIESDQMEANFSKAKGFEVVNTFVSENNIGELCSNANVVSLINVLEHIKCPSKLLESLSRSVNTGTKIVIELPRHPSISSFSCLAFPDIACRHIYPPDHLHVFSERSMHSMLETLPLSVEGIWNFGQDIHDLLQAVAVSSKLNLTPFISYVLMNSGKLQLSCDAAGLSDTIIMVCKKIDIKTDYTKNRAY